MGDDIVDDNDDFFSKIEKASEMMGGAKKKTTKKKVSTKKKVPAKKKAPTKKKTLKPNLDKDEKKIKLDKFDSTDNYPIVKTKKLSVDEKNDIKNNIKNNTCKNPANISEDLFCVINSGKDMDISKYIKKGADPNYYYIYGKSQPYYSLLDKAVLGKKVKMVASLLENGADPNLIHNYQGISPLTLILKWRLGIPKITKDEEKKTIEIVTLLVKHGADLNYKNNNYTYDAKYIANLLSTHDKSDKYLQIVNKKLKGK
jgi:ankyrin repeat protein